MRKTLTTLAIAVALGSSSAAFAAPQQGNAAAQAPMQQQAPEIDVSDKQLEQFVDAMTSVQEISGKYTEQFQSAETAEDAQAIQQKAQEEMIEAVNDSGLSADEYNTIVQAVQTDEELRARMQELTE
ncbi:DUF4168 domain-containing protein [Pseudidiomarina aestuarii]|uniref:DUF4168 domain-containing protein n=1 Tax=Pseudidiomarina aestuarii TaxID=624146 RepID=UPI003A973C48